MCTALGRITKQHLEVFAFLIKYVSNAHLVQRTLLDTWTTRLIYRKRRHLIPLSRVGKEKRRNYKFTSKKTHLYYMAL
jgi:hypothetical protein